MKYLKFDSEAQFKTAFAEHMIKTEDGETATPYIGSSAVDVVGVIYKPTGKILTDAEGMQYPERVPIDGWHVNLSGNAVPEGLEAFEIAAPATPSRIFAGD